MIKEIELINWKSFKKSKLYIDPLTILIGTNASGKSNILDALLFLQRITMGKQVNAAISGDMESKEIRGGIDWIIAKNESNSEISVVIQSDEDQNTDYTYEIKIAKADDNRLEIKSESLSRIKKTPSGRSYEKRLFYTVVDDLKNPGMITYFNTGTRGRGKRIDLGRSFSVLHQSKSLKLTKEVAEGIHMVFQKLSNIFILDPIPSLMRGYTKFSDTLLSDASNISGVLAALDAERKNDIEKVLTKYLDELPEKDIFKVWVEPVGKFRSDAMLYCQERWNDQELIVDARGMSDGTLRFLAIMTALLTIKKNSLLVIEEIDNGFHPSRANVLVRFLKEVGSSRNIDVICTTHNPAFLDALGNEMIVFISVVFRSNTSGESCIKLLEEVENLSKLIGRGSIGKLASQGVIEQSIKNNPL
ncbi:MAG: AAA family ATPase [Bernardetiaceae bacterium]